jgi:TetR/AcrR family transcriptional regulator, mexJK operon transcriptional repressor
MLVESDKPGKGPSEGRLGKDERRAAILEIARTAFLQNGYAATSMSQIAAKLGGSKATLYSYFPSKKDLFFAVTEAESAKTLEHLYDVGELPGDIREALLGFCRRFIGLILSDDMIAFYRLVVAESVRFPEIGQACNELGFKRGLDRMEGFLRKAVAAGTMRKADTYKAAEFLLDLGAGYMHKLRLWNVAGQIAPEEIERQARLVTAAFLAIYGNVSLAREARETGGL